MTELFSRAKGKQSILYSICSHVYRMSYYIVHGEDQSLERNVTTPDRALCQAYNTKKMDIRQSSPENTCDTERKINIKWPLQSEGVAEPPCRSVLNDAIVNAIGSRFDTSHG